MPHLGDGLADLARGLRQALRTEHYQGHDQDHEDLHRPE
jgi:hypothetical protein